MWKNVGEKDVENRERKVFKRCSVPGCSVPMLCVFFIRVTLFNFKDTSFSSYAQNVSNFLRLTARPAGI